MYPFIIEENETWTDITEKEIPGISPIYQFSNYDRVRNKITGHIKSQRISNGYLTVTLSMKDNHSSTTIPIHRLKMLLFNYVDGCESLQVDHIDTYKTYNDLSNLEWVTPKENIKRAHDNNLCKVGEDYYKAIFTNDQVEFICRQLSNGIPIKNISDSLCDILGTPNRSYEYNIYSILYRDCWRNISDKYIFHDYNRINFTNDQVKYICELLQKDVSYDDILISLGYDIKNMDKVSIDRLKTTISNIRNKRSYTDISKPYSFDKFNNKILTEDDVVKICKLISKNPNLSNKEIVISIFGDNMDYKKYNKIRQSVSEIRTKRTHRSISDRYFTI